MLTLRDVIVGLGGAISADASVGTIPIQDTVIDSRRATPGSMFIALRGQNRDGHDFVDDAFARGTIVALIDHEVGTQAPTLDPSAPVAAEVSAVPICIKVPDTLNGLQRLAGYWRTRHSPRVVGITGSVGKTTTKEMIYSVLRRSRRVLRNQANLNNEIGLPLTLLKLDPSYEYVVLEMGMYDLGEIRQLADIARPAIGVITNVGPTHLERLKTIERVAQAKAELVQALPDDGVAILNIDDPFVREMAGQTRARVFFYGLQSEADLWASDIESKGLEGIRLQLHYRDETIHLRVPLLGRHSAHTVLRAAAVGVVEGASWEDIAAGLQDTSVDVRLVSTPGPRGSLVLDDTYNSSPASALAALTLLEELEGRRIAVLGDMLELGDYAEIGHRKVGTRARDVVAKLITVGPLGRLIADEARDLGMAANDVISVDTNTEAVDVLERLIEPGDVVLVKGSRGMRMDEIVTALGRPVWPTPWR